jgi:D-lactate dehydrogenase
VYPEALDSLCCGQPFASKGYPEQAATKKDELISALLRARSLRGRSILSK